MNSFQHQSTTEVHTELIENTDKSNENGTLTNKPYWNEGTLKGDKIH